MEYENDMEMRQQIGQRLREARKKAGMKQREVAERAGITPVFYGNLERGERVAKTSTLAKICDVLGTSLEHITTPEVRDIDYFKLINEKKRAPSTLRDPGGYKHRSRKKTFARYDLEDMVFLQLAQDVKAEEAEEKKQEPEKTEPKRVLRASTSSVSPLPVKIKAVYTTDDNEREKLTKALDDMIRSASALRDLLNSNINIRVKPSSIPVNAYEDEDDDKDEYEDDYEDEYEGEDTGIHYELPYYPED